jgi:hypothetical protein
VTASAPGAGVPSGSVTVTADTGETCSGTLEAGQGACELTLTHSGARTLAARYSGDGSFTASTSTPVTHTVLSGQELLRFAGVASMPGTNGTLWRSELVLASPGEATHVELSLTPRGASASVATLGLDLAADEVRRITDVYAALEAEDGAGLLTIATRGAEDRPRPGHAWVRTYNQAPTATFGQDVPGIGSLQATPAGETRLFPIHTPESLTTGTRSNLLLQSFATVPVMASITSGTITKRLVVPPGAYIQQDNVGAWLGLPAGMAVITVTVNGPWAATVSSVDAFSGDPTTVRGLAASPRPVVLFPGVASRAGLNGTQWLSEATLHNPAAESRTALLEILNRETATVVASRSFPLAPSEALQLPDLYEALGVASGAGMLRVSGGVLAWVRTFNQAEASTFGQDVPPVVADEAVEAGEPRLFPVVSTPDDPTADFRSNLLLVNHEGVTLAVTITALGNVRTVFVPPGAYMQLNEIGSWLDLPPGWAVASLKANGRWSGVVSTIDPVSGDPTTVLGLQ